MAVVGIQEWSEQEMGRDMWPSFAGMLELGALKRIYSLQRIHKENILSDIFRIDLH